DGIQSASLGRKAEIAPCEWLPFHVGKRTGDNLSGPFAEHLPRSRAVNRLAVHAKPTADRAEHFLFLLSNRAVGPWPNIEQHRTVLADDVDQVIHDVADIFIILIGDVTPRVLRHRRIRLPKVLPNVSRLTALNVEHTGAVGERPAFPFLEVDR